MFTTYFLKILNYLPLQKSKVLSCIIEGLGHYFDKIHKDIIYTRNQFMIQLADKSLISEYGSSRGITRSKYDNDDDYRKRVLYAYKWIELGGKVDGLITILADYGFPNAEFKNLRDDYSDRWVEFQLKYPDKTVFEENQEKMVAIVNQYKPARSLLSGVIMPYNIKGSIFYAGISRQQQMINIYRTRTCIKAANKIIYAGVSSFPQTIKRIL